MDVKSTKRIRSDSNLRKILLNLLDIQETTTKGKKWVRVKDDQHVKWV